MFFAVRIGVKLMFRSEQIENVGNQFLNSMEIIYAGQTVKIEALVSSRIF